MSIFFIVAVLFSIDVHAFNVEGMRLRKKNGVQTYRPLCAATEESSDAASRVLKKGITPFMACVHKAWAEAPFKILAIIESYYKKQWIAVNRVTDQGMPNSYMCLTYINGEFAAGTSAGNIEFYAVDASTRKNPIEKAHSGSVSAITCSPDAPIVYSGGHDLDVKVWRAKDRPHASLKLSPAYGYATALLLSGDNRLILGSRYGGMREFNIEERGEMTILPPSSGKEITSLAKLNDKCLISSSCGEINIFDTSARWKKHIMKLGNFYSKVSVVGDNRFAVMCGKSLTLWDMRKLDEIVRVASHEYEDMQYIAMLGKDILTGSEDGTVRLHDAELQELAVHKLDFVGKKNITALAADPDGSNFVVATKKPVRLLTCFGKEG